MTAREKEFPQKRVILPVFAEVFSFSSEKPQNKTTFTSTKKGNFTRFCGSLLILTILQVFSSPTTDYTAERLSNTQVPNRNFHGLHRVYFARHRTFHAPIYKNWNKHERKWSLRHCFTVTFTPILGHKSAP